MPTPQRRYALKRLGLAVRFVIFPFRMTRLTTYLLLIVLAVSWGCSSRGTEVAKPRYHKSWYKNHKWNKRYKVWRIQVRPFERQGVRNVKMKG